MNLCICVLYLYVPYCYTVYPVGLNERCGLFFTLRTSSARHARCVSSTRFTPPTPQQRDKPRRTEPASQDASPRSSHTRNTGDVTPPDFDPRIHHGSHHHQTVSRSRDAAHLAQIRMERPPVARPSECRSTAVPPAVHPWPVRGRAHAQFRPLAER